MRKLDEDPDNGINLKKIGLIYTAFTEEEVNNLKRDVEFQHSMGVKTRFLKPEEVKELMPDVGLEELTAATYNPEDAYVDQYMLTSTLAKMAREKGVKIFTGTEAYDIILFNDSVEAVRTDKGDIEAPFVVNAGGPWADRIFEMVNLIYPVQRVPGQIYAVKPEKKINYTVPLTIDTHSKFYFREETGNIILLGQIDTLYRSDRKDVNPDDYYGFKKMPDSEFQEFIYKSLEKRFPMLIEAELIRGWVGLRTVTPDNLPIIGETEVSGFLCSVGYSGQGIQLAPTAGELIADFILNNNEQKELIALSINRFV